MPPSNNRAKCTVCRRRFVYLTSLIKHVQRKHPGYIQIRNRLRLHRPEHRPEHLEDIEALDDASLSDSDAEYESDSSDDDIQEELNPEDGEVEGRKKYTEMDAGKTYPNKENDATRPHNDDDRPLEELWDPFQCEEDYYLAKWFVDHQITSAAIDDYFSLAAQFPTKFYQGHLTSSFTLFKVIDKMTYDLGWTTWKKGTVCQRLEEDRVEVEKMTGGIRPPDTGYSTFYYRNPVICVQFLLSQERFKEVTAYEPYKDLHTITREVEEGGLKRNVTEEVQVYGDMHTADWWWNAQVSPFYDTMAALIDKVQHTIPRGGTLIPVIGSSDQTHLTSYSGDKKMWPVFLTIGNILSATRSKPSQMCNILVALLPIPPKHTATGKGKTAKDELQRALCREALRQVMKVILQPLNDVSKEGKLMKCPDGATRLCFPRISCWLADHAENVVLHSIKGTSCVMCEAPRSTFGQPPGVVYTARHGHDYLKHLLKFEANPRDSTSKDYLTRRDVKLIEGCFWQFPPETVDLTTLARPDMLHTVFLGVLKHLMDWIVKFLEAHERMQHFNQIWRQMPSFPDFLRFNKDYTAVSQWQGKEMRSLGRVILPVLAATLRNGKDAAERQQFKDALKCVKALVDFHLHIQYRSHDKHTIARARSSLEEFHRYKDVFLLYRAGRSTKADATSLRASLTKQAEASRNVDLIFKRLSKATKKRKIDADKAEIERQVSKQVREESSFDFVKMHYLTHFIDHISLFGSVQAYSTELLEASHPALKAGFRASNKVNATEQVLTHMARRESFKVHKLHQLFLAEERTKPNPLLDGPSEPKPRRLQGPMSSKIASSLRDVVREAGISATLLPEMVANYFSYYLKDRTKYEEDEYKYILEWKATVYNTLAIPVTKLGTAEEQKRMPVRCTGDRPWRTIYPPRKDSVFVWMDDIGLYGALRGRLPARLRCLLKCVDPVNESSHLLAIVETFDPENGGSVGDNHGLVTVSLKRTQEVQQRVTRGAGRTFIVPVRKILGPAHMIPYEPHEGNTKWFVNSTIDLETYNAVY
jgi:hypothetical protein